MYQGFEQDPKRTATARLLGLGFAWVIVTAFAVALFVQTLYQSAGAEILVGAVLAGLVLLPIYSKLRGRAVISTPPTTGSEVARRH